jgi:hypothetical protein
MPERVIEGQNLQLLVGGIHQALFTEAQGHAPEAGHGLQVALTLVVDDEHAVAALDDQRPQCFVRTCIGERMQLVAYIFRCE